MKSSFPHRLRRWYVCTARGVREFFPCFQRLNFHARAKTDIGLQVRDNLFFLFIILQLDLHPVFHLHPGPVTFGRFSAVTGGTEGEDTEGEGLFMGAGGAFSKTTSSAAFFGLRFGTIGPYRDRFVPTDFEFRVTVTARQAGTSPFTDIEGVANAVRPEDKSGTGRWGSGK